MIVMRGLLNVKQQQAISKKPVKGGGGDSIVACFLVTSPDGSLFGQATLARLLHSGQVTRCQVPVVARQGIQVFRRRILQVLHDVFFHLHDRIHLAPLSRK